MAKVTRPFMENMFDKFGSADSLEAELGDIIEFTRIGYMHYAIYIGNGMTIGVGGPEGKKKISEIVEESVRAQCDGDRFKCRVNNLSGFAKLYLTDPRPYEKETIVKRALEKKGEKINYDLNYNNCEVFATEIRYGVGFTVQGDFKGIVVLRWVKNVAINVATLPVSIPAAVETGFVLQCEVNKELGFTGYGSPPISTCAVM